MISPLVLVVEDEAAQQQVLAYNIRAEGMRVAQAVDGEAALLAVAEEPPDLIVLDWMLPKLSGIEVCRRLKARAETREIPVIMLSARSEEGDLVRGLNTGADDYVTKPYSLSELMARIRANLRRRHHGASDTVLECGDIRVDTARLRVFVRDNEIHLGPTELRLLAVLATRPGRVFSREALLDKVWGRDVYVNSRTVDVHIGRLRKALRAGGADAPIRTVRGEGYGLG